MIDLKTQMDEVILRLVPVGEENAMTARRIWRQMDIGTIAGVKFKLNRMVAHGLLERKHAPTFSVEASFYFRKEPSRSASSTACGPKRANLGRAGAEGQDAGRLKDPLG